MSRRLLVPLLSALALLLAAGPAALAAAAPPSAPLAAAAVDDETWVDDDACSDDPEVDLPPCEESWDDGSGDDAELCDVALEVEPLRASGAKDSEEWSEDDEAWVDDETWLDDCEPLAPTVGGLAVAVAGRGAATRLRVAFSLDLPGAVELTLARVESGVTRRRRCVAAPARAAGKRSKHARRRAAKRAGRRCTRTVALRGVVAVDGVEGANAVELRRRWGGRALAAGSYRLTATPVDEGGRGATAAFALRGRAR
ncbi:hypothetical protein [Conexibacter arvalis]|uniref:Uncharacterized protein n=1 Tax=Conexibacter arvalis TaxID=912552 RepID=A0A840ID94_9ACTN|nr:hypothetical protein [Conexibacter arvalis]MBB4662732.1 hypothetical protein [Conexibacter arvalis]